MSDLDASTDLVYAGAKGERWVKNPVGAWVSDQAPGVYARVVADSTSPDGQRLTTIEVRGKRYVLAEFNTHRAFSRNSASSRAIPLQKQVDRIVENQEAVYPPRWGSEQKGMQAGDEISPDLQEQAAQIWAEAGQDAINAALRLGEIGVHKSLANRLLEPFMLHTIVVTATAWENFFHLRLDTLAEDAIRHMAEVIKAAMDDSRPKIIDYGMWHLPYIDPEDIRAAEEYLVNPSKHSVTKTLVAMSSARCARVSYLTQDGKRDVADDLGLYERLTSNGHSSPLEHPATPNHANQHHVLVTDTFSTAQRPLVLPRYGNLLGWHQHRFDIEVLRGYEAYR